MLSLLNLEHVQSSEKFRCGQLRPPHTRAIACNNCDRSFDSKRSVVRRLAFAATRKLVVGILWKPWHTECATRNLGRTKKYLIVQRCTTACDWLRALVRPLHDHNLKIVRSSDDVNCCNMLCNVLQRSYGRSELRSAVRPNATESIASAWSLMNFEHVQSSDATSCDHSRIVQSLATDAINRKTVSNRSYDSKQSVVRQLKKNAAAGRKPTVRSLWKPLKKFVSGTATDKRWKAQGRGAVGYYAERGFSFS